MGPILDTIKSDGLTITDLSTRDTDLEEIFLAIIAGDSKGERREPGQLEKIFKV